MSMDQTQHPPPQANSPGSRPRAQSRGLSFASNRSGGSDGNKLKPVESPKDKARRDSFWKGEGSKSNPNAAINEVQPGEANLSEQSTLLSLRDHQHRDAYGNAIADPDLSNPTRPRLERPLDTIRSFERAIDEGYKRRSTFKPEAEPFDQHNQYASRRSSYFGGESPLPSKRFNRMSTNISSLQGYDAGPSPSRYAPSQQGGYYGSPTPGSQRQRYGNRMQSDPQFYNQSRPYPQQHGYHNSHDTVNTHGSDSTGPWANSTDPSSENSSLDRVNGVNSMSKGPADMHAAYNQGQNGYNGPIMEEQGQGAYGDYPYQNGYGQQQQQQNGMGRGQRERNNTAPSQQPRPMQLNSGPPPPSHGLPPASRPEPEKRKSWLSRKFSKGRKD
ncbi:uncharacterized protein LTR77_003747 [Saxophila tyrrhenica]|uniref:Uncharacterized protein n=1 Tax=Saxophila tyrrhenica TaxID=1690608 RepID=A0AAV9PI06_9PEZI|nr:hypothetical protein LTR77_003747 [Saxophila tyrrhenica]